MVKRATQLFKIKVIVPFGPESSEVRRGSVEGVLSDPKVLLVKSIVTKFSNFLCMYKYIYTRL